MTETTPPTDSPSFPFERAALGAALQDADARQELLTNLRADDFHDPATSAVFAILNDHNGPNEAALDSVLVADALITNGTFDPNRAYDFIADLLANATVAAAIPTYIDRIRGFSDARKLTQLGFKLQQSATSSNGDLHRLTEVIGSCGDDLREITDRVVQAPWETIHQIVDNLEDNADLQPIFKTGLPDLDRTLEGGIRPKQLGIIAARPAQGKSTLSLDLCRSASIRQGVPGLFVSLEMSKGELGARLLSAETQVPLSRIQRNNLEEQDVAVIEARIEGMANAPLIVCDSADPTRSGITNLIRSAHRRFGIRYVVIDYMQLTQGDPGKGEQENIAGDSKAYKALARELNIAVIMVSQLNRGPEQRTDKKPMMSDLRGSGQLEQDADWIFLVFRPETYNPIERPGEADVFVAKNRNGETATISLVFQGHYARFASYTAEPGSAFGNQPATDSTHSRPAQPTNSAPEPPPAFAAASSMGNSWGDQV